MNINKIYNEDCLKTMLKMEDGLIDLTVTSPPYDNLRKYKGYSFDFENIAKELYRITKLGGVVVWIVNDQTINGSESGTSFKQALFFKDCGFDIFDTMIYQKSCRGAVGNNKTYWQSFEYMFILSKAKPKTINLIKDRENKELRAGDNGTRRTKSGELLKIKRGGYGKFGRRTNVWSYLVGKGHSTKDDIAFNHPAIFPENLAKDHIISWSDENDLIFDPFAGSGTTLKMAIELNRNYIGSEISKEYVDIINNRLKLK